MRNRCRGAVIAVLFFVCSSTANAALQRAFVSSATGSDANACTRPLPCRNFVAALAAINAGGEIVVLDSGGYGATTIDRSVSITSPSGVYAGITGVSGTAITVASGSSGIVSLRGLSLTSQGATTGIDVQSANVVQIDDSVVSGFVTIGIGMNSAGNPSGAQITIRNTTVKNGDPAASTFNSNGIAISGNVKPFLNNVHVDRYGIGLLFQDTPVAVVGDTTVVNADYGMMVLGSSSLAQAYVDHSQFIHLRVGVLAGRGVFGTNSGTGGVSIER